LQSFVWQQLDQAPDFRALRRFLEYWRSDVMAKLHSVRVAQTSLLSRAELRHARVSL